MFSMSEESQDPHQKGREFYLEGLSLGREGRHEDALTSFSLALAIDPGLALAWVGRGFALGNWARTKTRSSAATKQSNSIRTASMPGITRDLPMACSTGLKTRWNAARERWR